MSPSVYVLLRIIGNDSLLLASIIALRFESARMSQRGNHYYVSIAVAVDRVVCCVNERFTMCFRPAGIDQFIECPECRKQVNAVLGVFPDSCPFCGTKVDAATATSGMPKAAAPDMPSMPKAPEAPKVPGVPKPPSALGTPRV